MADGFAPADESGRVWAHGVGPERRECFLLPQTGIVAFEIEGGDRRVFFSSIATYSVSESTFVSVAFLGMPGEFVYRLMPDGTTVPMPGPDGRRVFGTAQAAHLHMIVSGLGVTARDIVAPRETIFA